MSTLKAFAVKHNVELNLVAHQVTPVFKPDTNYPEPNIYTIKGGGTFADKADNVLIIWRENRNTNPFDTLVAFISKKIKKQKLTGLPGRCDFNFDRRRNRYTYGMVSPLDKEIELQTKIEHKVQPNYNFYEVPKDDNGDEMLPF
jgi:hypothetical protein